MERFKMPVADGSSRGKGVESGREQGGKYSRYNEDQIKVLEKAFAECSNPDQFQRAFILREQPALRSIDDRQLKVWFQNRRSREKQKKESEDLVSENQRLIAAKKLLREENDALQRKAAHLISENKHLQNQVLRLTSSISTFDLKLDLRSGADLPEMGLTVADNNQGLLSLAEETRNEFLSKVIGNAINWIPVLGLKLGSPGVSGTVYISSTCIGVAARACSTIEFEPFQIMEMLNDRPSWSRFCHSMNVLASYPANNGGTIELIHTKYYAPTTMALARDFWTLRYSSVLDDGSFVVCEKSISGSGSDSGPSSPVALEFVRGKMLASGYVIFPAGEGWESTIQLVEHFDFETSSVPEVVRPLYESSELLAKKTVFSALRYLEHVANEMNGKLKHVSREDPALLRTFSQRLSRGFNDAVNCFPEDGWTLMNAKAYDDAIMSTKQTTNFGVYANCDSILCLKASLLLQNVVPASLLKLLKERRSSWMGFNFLNHLVASRPASYAFPGLDISYISEHSVLLGHTNHEDEALEIIQLDRADRQLNYYSRDLYHLQVSNGIEDNGFGVCSELIFAPVDGTIPNDAAQLSCGFRIFLLGSDTVEFNMALASVGHPKSMLVLAFQFPYEVQHQDEIVAVARLYVKHVMSSVDTISREIMVTGFELSMNPAEKNQSIITQETNSFNLATTICQSYRSILGVDLSGVNCEGSDPISVLINCHHYAILCFSFTFVPVCLYANQAALCMLQTAPENLHTLPLDSLFGGSDFPIVAAVFPTITQQGYTILPPGCCISARSRPVSYGHGVAWRVQSSDGYFDGVAFAFVDWSFVQTI